MWYHSNKKLFVWYFSNKSFFVCVGSHSSHVPYARDLCEAHIYAADTASEEESDIHQSTTHTYRNAVIFVPVN